MWIILYISRIHCYGYRILAVYNGLLSSLNRRYIGDRYMWKRVISGVQADTVGFVWFHKSERELTFSCESDLLTARSTVKPQKYDWNSRWPVRHVRGFVAPTVEPCWMINHQLLVLSLFEIRNKNPTLTRCFYSCLIVWLELKNKTQLKHFLAYNYFFQKSVSLSLCIVSEWVKGWQ